MINRIFGLLGFLASVMAMSSLIYSGFQESVGPYMQGVMGGTMDIYRLMRDYVFSAFGWTLSGLINFAGQWLSFLPPAPWIIAPAWMLDILALISLVWISGKRSLEEVREYYQSTGRTLSDSNSSFARVIHSTIWWFVTILVGAVAFFLLAYAENRIGL